MMSWTSWLIALLAWPAIGLVVAYLFGRFVRGVETDTRESDERLPAPVVLYLRHAKRVKTSLRARATPNTRSRRQAGGQRAR